MSFPEIFKKASPMSMVGFPLLLIPLAIYNIIVFLMPGVSLTETLVAVPLTSGADWPVTLSEILLALGILMLLLEVIKGARPGAKYLTDHLLSLIVFGAALAEFLLWPRFANSTYFLLVLLALTDFLTSVALRVRRPPAIAGTSRSERRAPVELRHEPDRVDAAAPSPANAAAGIAHPEPKFTHYETAPAAPSPAAEPSAELKSGSSEPPPPDASH